MPYELEIEACLGVVIETWTGQLTLKHVAECIQERRAHPDYHESTPRLVDLSAAHGDLSADEIAKLAEAHASSPYSGRCAFVAPRDIQYGLSRMFEMLVGDRRTVAIFRSKTEAMRWLSLAANSQNVPK